ncbi:prolyl aminopeptidase [Phytoactinopolyspora alkaliphila]|uniref:Proline iminopeptidase n=1 Tax=Phytoactinopolyspora alkaliphila TaxID=1783498 RepID=A0A6N9YNZ8_9ACTN|nr:prolyl aminopeptidase [Phytoactinopolyspora alkaliphila]
MSDLYVPTEATQRGLLDAGDGNRMYWETSGSPDGVPALIVHGGPGTGSVPSLRRYLNPDQYRVISFDQRGCGQSVPHASDPSADMSVNTTEHLLGDMERLREHLGIERWVLFGGSWGSTLILAYAERYPRRVSGIVLAGVTTSRRSELEWLYEGLARFFPREWEQFRAQVPAVFAGDVVAGYARLMEDPDPQVRERAAHAWVAWEDAVVSMEHQGKPDAYSDRPHHALLAFVRICAHYAANGAFLEDGVLLRDAGRLAGIPGVLVHGRLDLGAPLQIAWELSRAWPDAGLRIVDDSGHTGSDSMRRELRDALDAMVQKVVQEVPAGP